MKRYSAFRLFLCLTLIFALTAVSPAQKRRTSGSKRRSTATTPKPPPDMHAEASLVSEQISNFTKFLYIYGKIANGLEVAEELASRGKSTPEVIEQNKQTKQALVANINGLRTGLEKLAKTFQEESRTQLQYLKLSTAIEYTGTAERLAAEGKYDEAGQALVNAIERMTETVISMRLL